VVTGNAGGLTCRPLPTLQSLLESDSEHAIANDDDCIRDIYGQVSRSTPFPVSVIVFLISSLVTAKDHVVRTFQRIVGTQLGLRDKVGGFSCTHLSYSFTHTWNIAPSYLACWFPNTLPQRYGS